MLNVQFWVRLTESEFLLKCNLWQGQHFFCLWPLWAKLVRTSILQLASEQLYSRQGWCSRFWVRKHYKKIRSGPFFQFFYPETFAGTGLLPGLNQWKKMFRGRLNWFRQLFIQWQIPISLTSRRRSQHLQKFQVLVVCDQSFKVSIAVAFILNEMTFAVTIVTHADKWFETLDVRQQINLWMVVHVKSAIFLLSVSYDGEYCNIQKKKYKSPLLRWNILRLRTTDIM